MDVAVRPNAVGQMQIAPLTGDNKGLRKAEIRQGVREVILCKDEDGKMGLRVRSVNKVPECYVFELPLYYRRVAEHFLIYLKVH